MKINRSKYFRQVVRAANAASRKVRVRLAPASAPERILENLSEDTLKFFNRKLPTGEKYPYEVHYAPTLQNVPDGLEPFYLIGRNWRQQPDAPIALSFGMNTWKYGFIADYCHDVRMAFAPRNFMGRRARRATARLKDSISRIYVWGYTDPPWIARFAARHGIPLIRVEDGFLRSADLGANHSTPYSLVFDSQGLYYNSSQPNDLTDILESYDFSADPALMQAANRARDIVIRNRLLKYNLPDMTDAGSPFRVKTRRRVVVIGQVDDDAAVRMGNPAKWKMVDIVKLAKLENPDAEIIYRPHPEVYRGFQKTRFRKNQVKNIATIASPEGSLVDLLDTADQVYTISSLSGLEALIRGVKVTTLGTPFYAGWGLTDDRVAPRRGRQLSTIELFAAVYLLYPRYLLPIKSIADCFEATALKICGDRILLEINEARRLASQRTVRNKISGTKHWPAVILNNNIDQKDARDCIAHFPLNMIMTACRHPQVQEALLALMFGWSRSPLRYKLARRAGALMDEAAYYSFLQKLLLVDDSLSAKDLMVRHLQNFPDLGDATDFLLAEIRANEARADDEQVSMFNGRSADISSEDGAPPRDSDAQNLFLYNLIDAYCSDRRYKEAFDTCVHLLLLGYRQKDILWKLLDIFETQFQFGAVKAIAHLLLYSPAKGDLIRALTAISTHDERNDPLAFAHWNSALGAARPSSVSALLIPKQHHQHPDEFERISRLIPQQVYLCGEATVPVVQALITLEDFASALEKSQMLINAQPRNPAALVVHAQALAANGHLDEAFQFMLPMLNTFPHSPLVYREVLRLCILKGDYQTAKRVMNSADRNQVKVGDMLMRKVYFGVRDPGSALSTFRHTRLVKDFKERFKEKYYDKPISEFRGSRIFLLPIYGPGDEIRFASAYSCIIRSLSSRSRVIFGCDPRLASLFRRSFPQASFVEVQRKIRSGDYFDAEEYNKIRHPTLRAILDNRAADFIEQVSAIATVTDTLAELRPSYSAFPGTAYLVHDKATAEFASRRLPSGKPLVGISWRSSISTAARNEHYLSIDDLDALFANDKVQYVNLQYDDCSDEIREVNERYPGRLFNPTWLDQYNDFDGVASLMSCLDLVISPANTVVELAGALGVETWLLSNSSELHWRRLENSSQDVWHSSVSHVEGPILQDKRSLIQALVEKLDFWAAERHGQVGKVHGELVE